MAVSSFRPRRLGNDPQETSPLLADDNARDESSLPLPHPHYHRVVGVVIVTVFLIEIGDYMMRAPTTRIMEDIICRHYYDSLETVPIGIDLTKPIPEDNCKVPAIQAELAMIRGWDMTFSCLPGLLLSIPYGVLADKYGRRFVTILSLIGVTLAAFWLMLVCKFSLL